MRTGLILAGGTSRRFGEPKPLVPFAGRPMVRWVGEALAGRCDELLLSIGSADLRGRFGDALPGVRAVRDVRSGLGPIEGLRRGSEAARGEVLLVAPADAPLLRPSLYDALLALLGDHEAAVPRHAALDPVRAVYRRDAVRRALREDALPSPSALVDRLDAVLLQGEPLRAADPEGLSFLDLNRREDLEAALRLATGMAGTSSVPDSY